MLRSHSYSHSRWHSNSAQVWLHRYECTMFNSTMMTSSLQVSVRQTHNDAVISTAINVFSHCRESGRCALSSFINTVSLRQDSLYSLEGLQWVMHIADSSVFSYHLPPQLLWIAVWKTWSYSATFWSLFSHQTFPSWQYIAVTSFCRFYIPPCIAGNHTNACQPDLQQRFFLDILLYDTQKYWPCCSFCPAVAAKMLWGLWSFTIGSSFPKWCPCFPWLTSKGSKSCASISPGFLLPSGKPSRFSALVLCFKSPSGRIES